MAKKSFPLRIDEEVFDQLRRWAEDDFRSVNGQIEYLLREALRHSGRKVPVSAPAPPESTENEAGDSL